MALSRPLLDLDAKSQWLGSGKKSALNYQGLCIKKRTTEKKNASNKHAQFNSVSHDLDFANIYQIWLKPALFLSSAGLHQSHLSNMIQSHDANGNNLHPNTAGFDLDTDHARNGDTEPSGEKGRVCDLEDSIGSLSLEGKDDDTDRAKSADPEPPGEGERRVYDLEDCIDRLNLEGKDDDSDDDADKVSSFV